MLKLKSCGVLQKGSNTCFVTDSRGERLSLGDLVCYMEHITYSSTIHDLKMTLCKVYTDGIVSIFDKRKVETSYYAHIFKVIANRKSLDKCKEQFEHGFNVMLSFEIEYSYGEKVDTILDYYNREVEVGDFVYFVDSKFKWHCGIVLSNKDILTNSYSKKSPQVVLSYKKNELLKTELDIYKDIETNFYNSVKGSLNAKTIYRQGGLYVGGSKTLFIFRPFVLKVRVNDRYDEFSNIGHLYLELAKDTSKIDMTRLNDINFIHELMFNAVLKAIHSANRGSMVGDKYSLIPIKHLSDMNCFRYNQLRTARYVGDVGLAKIIKFNKKFNYKTQDKDVYFEFNF